MTRKNDTNNLRDTFDQTVWGPIYHWSIYFLISQLPDTLTIKDRVGVVLLFDSLKQLLPCPECRVHYQTLLENSPVKLHLNSRDTVFQWYLNVIHNDVRKRHGKTPLTSRDILTFLNSRCSIVEDGKLELTHMSVWMPMLEWVWHSIPLCMPMDISQRELSGWETSINEEMNGEAPISEERMSELQHNITVIQDTRKSFNNQLVSFSLFFKAMTYLIRDNDVRDAYIEAYNKWPASKYKTKHSISRWVVVICNRMYDKLGHPRPIFDYEEMIKFMFSKDPMLPVYVTSKSVKA